MDKVLSSSEAKAGSLFKVTGRLFHAAALLGLAAFGAYILFRATGRTSSNFVQWKDLVEGESLTTASEWIANIGIGVHFFMGAVLVLAWPILFSAHIRAQHRAVHRWTGRVYVTAGFLAGAGGLSFILARHDGGAAHIAFALWGLIMMVCAVMAFYFARAKRFVQHRAWAIRLFAVVLGAWLFDVEERAWADLTGGFGTTEDGDGPFNYALLYLFFIPNLLVAELFIRNWHKRVLLPVGLRWALVAAGALVGLVFLYSIVFLTAMPDGRYGKHLFALFSK